MMEPLQGLLVAVVVIGLWVLLQLVVLPRLGVGT